MISVIIATYNREQELCNTLQNLLDQSVSDHEIIVIDQSKTHGPETMEFLERNSSELCYYKLSYANLPAARNFGVSKARGDIILFLDDDVVLAKDLIQRIDQIFDREPEIAGLTGLSRSSNTREDAKWDVIRKKYRARAMAAGSPTLWPALFLPGFFMCFRKQCLMACGGFDEWIGTQRSAANEDGELCLRLRLMGYKLAISTELQVVHLSSLTGGCGVRSNYDIESDDIRYNQFKMSVYGIVKNRALFSFQDYLLNLIKYTKNYYSLYNFKLTKSLFVLRNVVRAYKEINTHITKIV